MKFRGIKLLLASLMPLALTACSMPVANVTGDQIVNENDGSLIVQSIVAMDESNINSMMGGQILEVLVKEGDYVSKDQPLVILNSDSLLAQKEQAEAGVLRVKATISQQNAAVAQAEAGLAAASASYNSVKKGARPEEIAQLESAVSIAKTNLANCETNLNTAKNDYDRKKLLFDAGAASLVELEGMEKALVGAQTAYENANSNVIIAQSKLEQAQNGATQEDIQKVEASVAQASAGVEAAKTGFAQTEASIKQSEAALKELEVALSKCTLKAPIDGIITSVNVKNGDMVSSGLTTVVVTDINNPYINCNIDETKLSQVTLEQPVKIKLSAVKDGEFSGKVVKINKAADFATKKASNDNGSFDILTYGAKIVFDNPSDIQDLLRAGMTAFVDFGK